MHKNSLPFNLIETTLVPHSGFCEAIAQLEQVFRVACAVEEPVCKPFIAESRTGKTRALDEFVQRHPRRREKDGLKVPILKVSTPSKPTVKGLAEAMLSVIGDPRPALGTEQQKTDRLIKLLWKIENRVIVVDEFHHFVDKGSERVQHYVADWLKVLIDACGAGLIVAGLDIAMAVLYQNEQLRGRFQAPISLPRFDWRDEDQRSEFVAILVAFEEVLRRYLDLPELGSANFGFRFYVATGGLMGYVTKLFKQLVWDMADANSAIVELEDFDRAYSRSIGIDPDGLGAALSPFRKDFKLEATEANLKSAAQVGIPRPAPCKRARKSADAPLPRLLQVA